MWRICSCIVMVGDKITKITKSYFAPFIYLFYMDFQLNCLQTKIINLSFSTKVYSTEIAFSKKISCQSIIKPLVQNFTGQKLLQIYKYLGGADENFLRTWQFCFVFARVLQGVFRFQRCDKTCSIQSSGSLRQDNCYNALPAGAHTYCKSGVHQKTESTGTWAFAQRFEIVSTAQLNETKISLIEKF